MYKKLLSMVVIVLLVFTASGCGKDKNADEEIATLVPLESIEEEQPQEETQLQEDVQPQEESNIREEEDAETEELTFADLSKKRFEFCSGAGGWSEEFTIEEDGYFTGIFHDSNMGEIGEGYDGGTMYYSSYEGHFTELTKINNYTYQMKLADISYDNPIGIERISDNILWIYTGSYCLGGTDTFIIYLPGTPIGEISEEIYSWIGGMNASTTELTRMVIVDEINQYGIYSIDITTPLEDALAAFENCKESYDYYGELLTEAMTTAEMVEYTGNMYNVADECLNYIWNLIRNHVDEEQFEQLLAEQRAWIVEKEKRASESASMYEGGSFAAVDYNDLLASMTYERCEELIEYLK